MNSFFQHILDNNKYCAANKEAIKKVLLLLEEERVYIGDTCRSFYQIKFCMSYFPNASIDINFNKLNDIRVYDAMLKNNPYVERSLALQWRDINFEEYDLVVCVTPNEELLLRVLTERYDNPDTIANFRTSVFSLTGIIGGLIKEYTIIFPAYTDLVDTSEDIGDNGCELYISDEEREWGNKWLEEKGVQKDEQVFIFLDCTSNMEKALKIDVYFEILHHYLRESNVKVLVFDERGIDKQGFYKMWLGEELVSRMIFSKRLPLRQDLCLIASDYIKFVFGPCTGLLHCASGIYNHFVNQGRDPVDTPLMVVYTGKYPSCPLYSPYRWWGDYDLVYCMVLQHIDGVATASLLTDLDEDNKLLPKDLAPCKEYTSDMIIEMIERMSRHKYAGHCPRLMRSSIQAIAS